MPQITPLPGLAPYTETLAAMEARVAAIAAGTAPEALWLLEHPPLYTAGTSSRDEDLTDPNRFPVHVAGRGGQFTYHGPGQRVAYVMLDLNKRGRDVHCPHANLIATGPCVAQPPARAYYDPGRKFVNFV